MKRDLKKIISQMTLEEKAGMCSGLDFWHLKSVERLGIPEVMVSDGPHAVSYTHLLPPPTGHLQYTESVYGQRTGISHIFLEPCLCRLVPG